MYNAESGLAVNREIEATLQDVQDLINLVDVLARATGDFLNSTRGSGAGDGKCFSDNVSSWLFDKRHGANFAALRRRQRAAQNAQEQYGGADDTGNRQDAISLASASRYSRQSTQPEFNSWGSSADGLNMASSYYTRELVSHHVSSHSDYSSPRSRYLDNQAQVVMSMRQRLAAFQTAPRSACELVGPIPSSCSSDKTLSSGKRVALSGGAYSNIKSYVDKSKSMFGDFVSPSNPNYTPPWENKRRVGGRSQFNRNRYSLGY